MLAQSAKVKAEKENTILILITIWHK